MQMSSLSRRRLLTTGTTAAIIGVAGCLGDDDGEPATPTPDDPTPTPDEQLTSTDPSPHGSSLSIDDVEALVAIFDDRPMNEDQFEVEGDTRNHTPRHVWKWVSDDSFIGLHFDDPNPEAATELDYVTIGRKGVFTEESQRDPEFTHFHQHTSDSWEGGHGGPEGAEGYWLTHLSVREIQYPFHAEPIDARVDYDFMPTPPPGGSTGHDTSFTSPAGEEGSLSAEDRDALLEVFTDRPFTDDHFEVDGQFTPRHVWKWVSEEVLLYLHFNEVDPRQATELDYFGIGVRGRFRGDDVPAGQVGDFTHFHKHEASGWEAGHGAQSADQWGYWLVHHAVRTVEYPFHDAPIDVGIDRDFMPTPLA